MHIGRWEGDRVEIGVPDRPPARREAIRTAERAPGARVKGEGEGEGGGGGGGEGERLTSMQSHRLPMTLAAIVEVLVVNNVDGA